MATPQELCTKEWNEIVRKKVGTALGAKLDGEFIAANYPSGFPYAVKQRFYNADSLAALDTLVCVEDEIPSMGNVYSTLYKNVIGNLEYGYSQADKAKINQEQTDLSAMVGTIYDYYKESDIYNPSKKEPTIKEIMDMIKDYTKVSYTEVKMKDFPGLAPLCIQLSKYAAKATFTAQMQNQWDKAYDRLQAIKSNIEAPSEDNGGIRTGAGDQDISIGWDKLPETEQLLNDLKQGNSVSFSVTADSFRESESNFHFDSSVSFRMPFNLFFNMKVDHEHSYDLSDYALSDSMMSITVTYNGITTLAAMPTPLSADNQKGWYANDILKEAAEKSDRDCTGYRLQGEEFDPDQLFGESGVLRRMKTLVLSQQPEISLHFEHFQCEEMSKIFTQKTDVEFDVLCGIISGDHRNDFTFSDFHYDSEEQTLDVSIKPTPIGDVGAIEKQTAYVLGGVAESYLRG